MPIAALTAFAGVHHAMFLRFTVRERLPGLRLEKGLFTAVYELERAGVLTDYEVSWFQEQETWFNDHLAVPTDVAARKAILWFKATADEHIRRMRAIGALLQNRDIEIVEHRAERPGKIVYDDEHQVAAVPYQEHR